MLVLGHCRDFQALRKTTVICYFGAGPCKSCPNFERVSCQQRTIWLFSTIQVILVPSFHFRSADEKKMTYCAKIKTGKPNFSFVFPVRVSSSLLNRQSRAAISAFRGC